jgi:hypothetical protein
MIGAINAPVVKTLGVLRDNLGMREALDETGNTNNIHEQKTYEAAKYAQKTGEASKWCNPIKPRFVSGDGSVIRLPI